MAQKYVSEVGTFIVPGAYPDYKVQADTSGVATTGVIAIIGEADAGAPGSIEDLVNNSYGPDQLADVVAKYKSGRIVDAFRALTSPANDADIQGSVNRVIIYKTNASLKASADIVNQGLGTFGELSDQSYGKLGNLIKFNSVESQAEVAPQTSEMTYIPTPSGAIVDVRVNGAAKQSLAVTALQAPDLHAAALDALDDILAQGGEDLAVLTGLTGTSLAVSVSGLFATFTLAAGSVFPATPQVGDTLVIPGLGDYGASADSTYIGAGSANEGAYVITAVSNTTSLAAITAKKVADAAPGGPTSPVAVTSAAIAAIEDILVYSGINVINISGADRNILDALTGTSVISVASGANLTFTLVSGSVFAATPQIGDIITIPAGSAYAGVGSANVGHYTVSSVSNTASSAFVTATRLSNGDPISVGSTPIAAETDIQCLRPVISGLGKSLEISDGGGTDSVEDIWKQLGTDTAVDFISSSLSPNLLLSAAEYVNSMGVSRQADAITETFVSGGDIAILLGYEGTTCSCTISSTSLVTAPAGGSGAALSLTLADFSTISDLVSYIDSQTGYNASLATALQGQRPPTELDEGSYTICSDLGSKPGRIKRDLASFEEKMLGSTLISFAATAGAGLPDPISGNQFLSGGALGATTGASVVAGFDACKGVAANFVVPLFSQDASDDILLGETDSGSTYTIDAINAAGLSHVLEMSTVKRKKHRQLITSKDASFLLQKTAAQNLASHRVSMAFHSFTKQNVGGDLEVFQPWMGAVLAAGMQAAGFRKSICHKFINTSGISHKAGDYDPNNGTDQEDALLNGLLPAEKVTGGYRWVSDQTTYSFDSNFVFNSIQAVYAADVVALSLAESMDRAFVGKSVADITAEVALAFVRARMNEFLRIKLTSPSSDAPLGFKNVVVKIVGPSMRVSLEVKLATAIYFIPISITISQVTQEASL